MTFFSDEYLAHYGVSVVDGAKVGSGRYRRGSGEHPRASKIASSYKESDRYYSVPPHGYKGVQRAYKRKEKAIAEVRNSFDKSAQQRIKAAFDEFVKSDKYSEGYREHEYEYKIKALDTMIEKYPHIMDSDDYKRIIQEAKENPNSSWLMVEDWDQGEDSSFNLYLKDHGFTSDQVSEEYLQSQEKFLDAVEREVEPILGEYGKVPIYDINEGKLRKKGYDDDTIARIIDTQNRRTITREMASDIADKYVYDPKTEAWVYTWML